MPWTKQFDVDAALDCAKGLFWSKGYQATSMDDLLRCMGIGRGSFYATYGSKQAVYAEVLERYDQEHRRDVLERLRREHPPKRAIAALFAAVRDDACSGAGSRGCFLANAALELAASDKRIARIVQRAFAETEAFFRDAVRDGQRAGEIRRDVDADATARALLGLLLGMRVLARAGGQRAALTSIARQAEEML